jgi:hypothetical protein
VAGVGLHSRSIDVAGRVASTWARKLRIVDPANVTAPRLMYTAPPNLWHGADGAGVLGNVNWSTRPHASRGAGGAPSTDVLSSAGREG